MTDLLLQIQIYNITMITSRVGISGTFHNSPSKNCMLSSYCGLCALHSESLSDKD